MSTHPNLHRAPEPTQNLVGVALVLFLVAVCAFAAGFGVGVSVDARVSLPSHSSSQP